MNTVRFIATIYESMASSKGPLIHGHSLFPEQQVEPLQRLLKGDKIPLERAARKGGLSYN